MDTIVWQIKLFTNCPTLVHVSDTHINTVSLISASTCMCMYRRYYESLRVRIMSIMKMIESHSFLHLPQFELKKSLVDHLVQLLSCGHVLPVVDYVAQCTEMESLDQSHIRHFVAEVHVTMYTYTSAINKLL